jgi:hypothetical protein
MRTWLPFFLSWFSCEYLVEQAHQESLFGLARAQKDLGVDTLFIQKPQAVVKYKAVCHFDSNRCSTNQVESLHLESPMLSFYLLCLQEKKRVGRCAQDSVEMRVRKKLGGVCQLPDPPDEVFGHIYIVV